jgi:AraC-like DNA-binding protein
MSRADIRINCPLGESSNAVTRFLLGRRDERFGIADSDPSHAVELDLASFDASSEREPGGMLVCILRGEIRLLGASGCWSLPQGHMVFIPAERSYRLAADRPSSLILVKFNDNEPLWHHHGCWAAPMPALAIEMASFAARWGAHRDFGDRLANDFFRTMGQLFPVWFDGKRKMWTPFGNAPDMDRAIAFARDHIETASVTDTASAVGMSERTLRRRFKDELGISWRDFITEVRMSEAMKLLGESNSSVTQAAYAVGFNSLGAFTVAFTNYTGKTPSAFAREHSPMRALGAH